MFWPKACVFVTLKGLMLHFMSADLLPYMTVVST